jgi:hypothetical protein
MPALQTSYNEFQPLGFEGQKVDGEEYNAITRVAENAEGLAFGKPAARGTADQGCIPYAASTAFLGITTRDVSIRPSAGDRYPQGSNVTILTQGSIFVRVTGTVAPGQAAAYNVAADRFTAAAPGAGILAATGWVFDSTAANNGIAKLVKR